MPTRARTESSTAHLALLALSIFLSAFLLFQVQPLISRWILPWFGGSTAVWTTCMLFFQMVLFCGYAYAHATFRWLGPRSQGMVHLALLALACVLLPIIPRDTWKPADSSHPAALIIGLLAATVGVPYFVLSSTGPLLQAWFANAFPGRSPYRLYALSNFGSLLALLSYPFFFEPLLGLHAQAWNWTAGFVVLALAIGICAWRQMRLPASQADEPINSDAAIDSPLAQPAAGPSLVARVGWVALPAFASVMLLATTNHVCQNIAVVPFLWVAPLSLYLLTFIICFDHARWYRRGTIAFVTVVLAFGSAGAHDIDFVYELSLVPELSLYLATMFGACLLCHGELVRLRPSPAHLTAFYLAMSAGGALGGILVSLVAPRVFTSFFEWNLSLLGTICLALCVLAHELAIHGRMTRSNPAAGGFRRYATSGGVLALGIIPLWYAGQWQFTSAEMLERVRNFYGVIRVQERYAENPERHHYTFRSGRVTHGKQFVSPEKRDIPMTYYGRHTGVGRLLVAAGDRGPIRVAVVGLGTGTLATYARPGDHYRFYEINPAVVEVARKWFTFLADCKGTTEVVDGDARLVLEQETVPPFDVIVLDAFSGDTVPVHLLTQEAFAIYRRRLREGGLIAVNVDNNHLQISSEVARQADAQLLAHTRLFHPGDDDEFHYRADWIIISGDESFLRRFPSDVPSELLAQEAQIRTIPLWTDHYSNLASLLINR